MHIKRINTTRHSIQHGTCILEMSTMPLYPPEWILHIALMDLQRESGSWDRVHILVTDEQRIFEGLSRGTGMEDADPESLFDSKPKVEALDLHRWKLTVEAGDCCLRYWIEWRQGRPYWRHQPYQALLASFEHSELVHCWKLKESAIANWSQTLKSAVGRWIGLASTTFEVRQPLGLHETLDSLNYAYLDRPDIRRWSDKRRILEMSLKGESAFHIDQQK